MKIQYVTAWIAGFVMMGLVVGTATAQQNRTNIDAFVRSLPTWRELSPPIDETDGEPTGAPPITMEEIGQDGTPYSCTIQPHDIAKNPDEIALVDPDASVLWPGALIHGEGHLSLASLDPLALNGTNRAPLSLSIQGGGVLGIPPGVSTTVDEPTSTTVREGINQLVVNALGADVMVGAGISSFTSEQSYSSEQTALQLGLSARYLGTELAASLDFSRSAEERTYTAYFIQRLFTIAVDLPQRPSSFFSRSMTVETLRSLGVNAENPPLYISSVSYGRILMFSFTSTESEQDIRAALAFAYDGPAAGVEAGAETRYRRILQQARIEVLAIGGPNVGVQGLIRNADLASYFEQEVAINQVEPIAFTLRSLRDNTLATVSEITVYDVETCSKLPRNYTLSLTQIDDQAVVYLNGTKLAFYTSNKEIHLNGLPEFNHGNRINTLRVELVNSGCFYTSLRAAILVEGVERDARFYQHGTGPTCGVVAVFEWGINETLDRPARY